MKNKYPIYVISKGRWKSPLTCRALDEMSIDYKLIIEPDEFENYSKAVNSDRIIVAPENFSKQGNGSIPVRNFVWEYSIQNNDKRHWILDDNIEQFNWMNNNLQHKCVSASIFRAAEDFVDRYSNVAIAGFEYDFFLKSRVKWNPFRLNTRIYSCSLIRNDLKQRWRGKYNEDTDLSIRVLKDGWCTILFLAFIQQKKQTMTTDGGNSDIYKETNERREFAESLRNQHPDIVKVTRKFGRWHHHVNYRVFKKNKLKRIKSFNPEQLKRVDNYGMELISK